MKYLQNNIKNMIIYEYIEKKTNKSVFFVIFFNFVFRGREKFLTRHIPTQKNWSRKVPFLGKLLYIEVYLTIITVS